MYQLVESNKAIGSRLRVSQADLGPCCLTFIAQISNYDNVSERLTWLYIVGTWGLL